LILPSPDTIVDIVAISINAPTMAGQHTKKRLLPDALVTEAAMRMDCAKRTNNVL
jgi:hypothetical protein